MAHGNIALSHQFWSKVLSNFNEHAIDMRHFDDSFMMGFTTIWNCCALGSWVRRQVGLSDIAMQLLRATKLTYEKCEETMQVWAIFLKNWTWEAAQKTGPAQYVHWNGITGFKDTLKKCHMLHAAELGACVPPWPHSLPLPSRANSPRTTSPQATSLLATSPLVANVQEPSSIVVADLPASFV